MKGLKLLEVVGQVFPCHLDLLSVSTREHSCCYMESTYAMAQGMS